MRVRNNIAVVIMLLLPVMLQGCGRKGPLYLQQKPPVPVQTTPAQAVPSQTEMLQAGPQTQPAQNAVIQTPIDTKKQP